jgi:hypothetical protein
VRALFDKPIAISSGYRNPQVNKAVGGVSNSAHALGHAADFHVDGLDDLAAAKWVRDSELKFDQLIYEKGRCVHISFDPAMRQQVMRQQDRLRRLQMSLARHDRGRMRRGLRRQCRHDLERSVGDPSDRIAQPQPEQRGHLVIS